MGVPRGVSAVMLRLIHRLEEWLIAGLLAAMTLLTFVQVVLRYVFNTGLIWALEATTYLFLWLVLIGISYGVRVNAHIGVDMVVKLFGPRWRRVVGLIAVACCFLYAGLMVYGSWVYIDKMIVLDVDAEDIPLPRWLLGIVLPIGFALLFVRLVTVAGGIWAGRRELLADEAEAALKSSGALMQDSIGTEETSRK